MQEYVAYKAQCNNCKWHMTLISEDALQYHAEAHMMEKGHTVEIQKVI